MSGRLILLSLIILASSFVTAYADEIEGIVVNKETQQGIAGAVIYFKNSKGIPVCYCTTDKEGKFIIKYEYIEGMTLEAKFLGYEPQIFTFPFQSFIKIEMKERPQEIQEVVVKASKVRQTGDTIVYNVPSLLSQNDKTLGDILRKLPGIDVSKDGFVKYRGKSINRLYIDGYNLLEGQYNIATKNLDPKMLKQVEIYEKHQPIKALEGVIDSDNAALNIVLKDGAKSKLITTLQAEAGGGADEPWIPYSATLWMMNIGKSYQTMNSLQTDKAGNDVTSTINENGVIIYEYSNQYRPDTYIGINHLVAPLEEKRTKFNTSYSASTNHKFSTKKKVILGFSGKYEYEALSSESSSVQIYDMNDGTSNTFTELNSVNTHTQHGYADFSAEVNTRKLYFKDKFKFDYRRNSPVNNLGGSETIEEKASGEDVNFMNDLQIIVSLRLKTS